MSQITEKEYREYLIQSKDVIFKILPLYEEKNEHIKEYVESVSFELTGLRNLIEGLPYGIWYVKTLATLEQIKVECDVFDKTKLIKKEIFKLLRIIDKQIDELRGV